MTSTDSNPGKELAVSVAVLLAIVCLSAVAAQAQVTIGNYLNMNLTGNLGYGYTGAFGNTDYRSNHGQGLTGSADLKGYYFHPNFLSFDIHPYYDRTQSNADSQAIATGSGIGGSVNLFGGSRFPGTVSYGKFFSNNSEFRIAGVPAILGDSSGQNIGISWSALIPNWPTLYASFSTGSSASSVSGIDGEMKGSVKTLSLGSTYRLAGWDLHGDFSRNKSAFTTPAVFTESSFHSEGTSTSYGVTAQHALPLSGALSLGWSRAGFDSSDGHNWTTNSYSAGANLNPLRNLSVSQNLTYNSNPTVELGRTLVTGDFIPRPLQEGTSALFYTSQATYAIGHGLSVTGFFNHRQQTFAGRDYSDNQYGGNLRYNLRSRLFGFLYFGVGLVDTANKFGNTGIGINGNVGASRKFGHWETSADFNYSQGVQTLGALATTSSYTYGASLRRRINRDMFWVGSFRGGHSGFGLQEGSGNRSEAFSSAFSWGRFGFAGNYSQSTGTAVFTSQGVLTSTPIAPLITEDFLYFNARGYSVTANMTLFRRLRLVAGYANVFSSTTQFERATTNRGEHYNAQMEYRLRKFAVIGGFNRGMQGSSKLPGPPRIINTFRISITRWFNVF